MLNKTVCSLSLGHYTINRRGKDNKQINTHISIWLHTVMWDMKEKNMRD
jgi:hypothetical protein